MDNNNSLESNKNTGWFGLGGESNSIKTAREDFTQ